MKDCLLDGLKDTLIILPYLYVTFVLLEFIEHKLNDANRQILTGNRKYGPLLGGLLGALPQCGFSSMAANLFSARVITMGTLIAVFLSTSDEMLPVMISEKADIRVLAAILGFKAAVGIMIGSAVDLLYRKQPPHPEEISELCEHDHCNCEKDGIFLSALKHTGKTGLFILIPNLIINVIIFTVGEARLSELLLNGSMLTYFLSSLIGLIPNCAGSVIITELYLSEMITAGTMLAGLLTGSGIGILLLFRANRNLKENLSILAIVYLTGVIIGMAADLIL